MTNITNNLSTPSVLFPANRTLIKAKEIPKNSWWCRFSTPIGPRKPLLRSRLILQATNMEPLPGKGKDGLYTINFPTIQPGVNDALLSFNRSGRPFTLRRPNNSTCWRTHGVGNRTITGVKKRTIFGYEAR